MPDTETPLSGGNMSSGVVRVGDTVRRPAGPWTPAVHVLLAHLHESGFDGAPRPLGIDEHGREVLTFIPGTPAWPDQFHLLDDDAQIRRAARLIRDFHDAVATFTPPPDPRWQALTAADGDEIIAHHDLAPWNLIIGSRQWAFIDWDTAAPGTRLRDPAYATHGFGPLSANPAYQRADAGRRLRLIADAYGLTEQQRRRATARPGRQTPATSPGEQIIGARHSSNNLQPKRPARAPGSREPAPSCVAYRGCVALSGEAVELAVPNAAEERVPLVGREAEYRPLRVAAVADADRASGQARHFNAVAVGETQRALHPFGLASERRHTDATPYLISVFALHMASSRPVFRLWVATPRRLADTMNTMGPFPPKQN